MNVRMTLLFLVLSFVQFGCSKTNSEAEIKGFQEVTDAYCACVEAAVKTTPKTRENILKAKQGCEPARKAQAEFVLSVARGIDPAAKAISKQQSACFDVMMKSIPSG